MRSITNPGVWLSGACMLLGILMVVGCGGRPKLQNPAESSGKPLQPFVIEDSSKIVTYPEGFRIYVVEAGAGDYPINGTNLQMRYVGRLVDGTVFDENFSHGEPLSFGIGSHKVIPGIEEAVKKLRLGSRAVAIIPPSLGYGDGQGKGTKELPPKIPANATLIFDMELIGTF